MDISEEKALLIVDGWSVKSRAELDYLNGKLVWAGATPNTDKAMPVFQHSKVRIVPIARNDFGHH